MAAYRLSDLARATLVALPVLAMGLGASSAARAHDIRELGDGKVSSSPKSGYLYSCQTQFRRVPSVTGPWIHGNTYDADEKPSIAGTVNWPNSEISVTVEGDGRIVRANNLPNHPTGVFPVSPNDPARQYARNPNSIREQNILLRLPTNPEMAAEPSCVPMGMIGFTLSGAAIYNAVDAGGQDAAAHELQDKCDGHPQEAGQYHYHSLSPCMPHGRDASGGSELIGYALDGFGVYGPYDASGRKLTNADLDACHGKVGPVMWDGKLVDMYHYVLTDQYPYSIGCFKGTPVSTGMRMGNRQPPQGQFGGQPPRLGAGGPQMGAGAPQQGPGAPRQGQGRNDPLVAVAGDLGVNVDTLRRAVGAPPPDLQRASQMLGIDIRTLQQAFMRHRPR